MDPAQIKTLLETYFSGRATPFQKRLLSEWLKDGENHEKYFQVLHDWEKANPQLIPDTDRDWQLLLNSFSRDQPSPEPIKNPTQGQPILLPNLRWMAAAAVLLLLMGWWQSELILLKTYETSAGEVKRISLPDGSRVILNANSTLTFPRFLAFQSGRNARLNGEAEFSVVHTIDDRPFTVTTPDRLEVRVLGTEFVVYSRNSRSKVFLNRGKITLRSYKSPVAHITVRPGELVTIDSAGTMHMAENQPSEVHTAWKMKRFVFDRTPLREVAAQIQERFDVLVVIPDTSLAERKVSGNYPAQSADEMIFMLCELFDLRQEKRPDNTVLLSK